ncbi:MAG: hypothetical protein KDN19_04845 [Verrucomicrobiae bacterium]|nr:hypothetical protein [Verrucomicrobiae bacterium]
MNKLVCHTNLMVMNDDLSNSLDQPKGGDAGIGEIFVGVMSLGFALKGWLDSIWVDGFGGMLLMLAILLPAWGIGYWASRAILKYVIWPRAGYFVPISDSRKRTGIAVAGRVRTRLTLITVLILTAVSAAVVACLAVFVKRPSAVNYPLEGILGTFMFACLVAAYAFWFVFNGRREYPWKWLVLVFLVLGFLVIGLPVRMDYLAVWPRIALFNGVMWLGSGLATLLSYVRHAKPSTVEMG